MENLCQLLFELSNEDRLSILNQLKNEAMNITSLSKTLDLTTQETSRQISRLANVNLTKRDSEGLHNLTDYGKLVLKHLDGLLLATKYNEYFTSHSITHLPPEFVYRIGDLSRAGFVDDLSASFYIIDRVIQESEKYIYTITDNYLLSTYPLLSEAIKRGVNVKNIESRYWSIPRNLLQGWFALGEDVLNVFTEARISKLLEERIIDRLDIYIYMSEKEVAVLGFPFLNGELDYLGYSAKDSRFHAWCKNLFQHFWERATPRAQVVEELYGWIKNKPKAILTLKKMYEGKEVEDQGEIVAELENIGLAKQGKITTLGDFLIARLGQ